MASDEQPHHLRLCNLTQTSPCTHLPFPCPDPASDEPSEVTAPNEPLSTTDTGAAALVQLLQSAQGTYRFVRNVVLRLLRFQKP